MKPIHLTWSGLQSYREKQEIDFTQLCDAGVFGIFGPTGSGKSTILDAMTLALYGKVERANKGTQGILNHAESIIAVSFTFELTHAEGSIRYRVERQYKRSTDVSVTNTLCRLIRIEARHLIHSENIVMADKVGEVDTLIQQILGLSMQDFSRAVVLPQGKFAEFLALKGIDRRQMLQRLFHLEHYGDELNARVSQRTKETDMVVKQVIAEQQGLGDASAQAVDATEAQLLAASQIAMQQRARLDQAVRHWEEQKQLRVWQQEKQTLESKHMELIAQEAAIAKQEQQLKWADQAGRIHHFLQEAEHANQQTIALKGQLEQITREHNEAAERYTLLEQQHTLAKEELNSQDAPLQVKVEQLKQAVLLEQDIQKGQLLEHELMMKLEHCKEQWHLSQADLQKKQDIHRRALEKQNELNEQLKLVEVKSESRQLLQNAARDKHAINTEQLKAHDLTEQIRLNQLQLTEEKGQAAVISEQQRTNQAQQQLLLGTANNLSANCTKVEHEIEDLHQSIILTIEALKHAEKAGEMHRFALHLAEQLQPEQPCPVCGSTEHPTPAFSQKEYDRNSVFSAAELDKLQKLLAQVQQMQFTQQRQSALQLDLRHKLAESIQEGDAFNPSVAEVAASAAAGAVINEPFPSPMNIPAAASSSHAEDLEKRYNRLVGEAQLTAKALLTLTEEMKRIRQHKERLAQQHITIIAQIQAKESIANGLIMRQTEAESVLRQQMQQWQAVYPKLKLETIDQEADKLTAMDREADQLRMRLQQSVPFVDEILLKIQEQTSLSGELEKQRIQLETEVKGQHKLNLDATQQFTARWGEELAGGGSIADRIHHTEQLLLELRQQELQARNQMEQYRQELQRFNEHKTSLHHTYESAGRTQAKAEQFWQEALAQTTFNHAEEVRDALLPAEQMRVWQSEVNQHREQEVRLKAKLEEIQSKLQNRTVLEEEWLEAERRMLNAREEDELALQNRAKAERDLEQIQSKHMYWTELQTKLLTHQVLYADLIKLQGVLRGNAFVEYLAEEQLIQVSRVASERLAQLTKQRYALEVDSSGGFVIRDDANGGVKRPVGTLSGGETFLTSLALALALSAQIQLSGQYPLEFFFLDEGFGTLDPDLLETVVDALEKLHIDRLTVGVISHVPELKARLPRKLIVESAEPGGRGSRVYIESL